MAIGWAVWMDYGGLVYGVCKSVRTGVMRVNGGRFEE